MLFLLISHLPSKAFLEVFFPLQGIPLSDSHATFAIHIRVKLVVFTWFVTNNT